MLEFIQLLKQRYQAVASAEANDYSTQINQLILAEASLRKGQLNHQPLHIAVIGPTQAGKSSLVNVLLNSNAAVVSPLAGYTKQAQGFCHGVRLSDCSGLQQYFGHFQQVSVQHLPSNRYDYYALSEIQSNASYLPACVLWDTPDFDSIDSAVYREGVLRTIALADLLILVVSKEKYADQSVWELMASLQSLQQPTLICLNKLPEGTEHLLIPSLQEKWQAVRRDKFPDVIPLSYQKSTGSPCWPVLQKQLLRHKQQQLKPKYRIRFAHDFIEQHWHTWLEPVIAEHQALREWQELLSSNIEQALEHYQRDYLNHPHHYETFQQALAELLMLLEVPVLAPVLQRTRRFLTLPVKFFLKLSHRPAESSIELVLLQQITEHLLIQLSDSVLDKSQQNKSHRWWQELSQVLRHNRSALLADFHREAKHYHNNFQQQIEQTAKQLYAKLQEQPILLNSLRATRATTDAALIALTVYAGGVGIHDLIVAPAMLSVTSLLAESAIGGYMQRVALELKQQQLKEVKQKLFLELLQKQLQHLPEQLSPSAYFHISSEQLQQAQTQLNKKNGLRLL